jgi:Sec-independent protein translocase protein TatA
MARDFGRFVQEAQRSAEDLKGELVSEEADEAGRAAEKPKGELGADKRESERHS